MLWFNYLASSVSGKHRSNFALIGCDWLCGCDWLWLALCFLVRDYPLCTGWNKCYFFSYFNTYFIELASLVKRYGLLTKREVKMAEYWSFLRVYAPSRSRPFINTPKTEQNEANIQPSWPKSKLKDLLYGKKNTICLWDTARNLDRARNRHFACSGSQSQRFPAHEASHMDIALFFFCMFSDLHSFSVHKHPNRELSQYQGNLTEQPLLITHNAILHCVIFNSSRDCWPLSMWAYKSQFTWIRTMVLMTVHFITRRVWWPSDTKMKICADQLL